MENRIHAVGDDGHDPIGMFTRNAATLSGPAMTFIASPAIRRFVTLSGVCVVGVLLATSHPAGAPQDKPAPAGWKVPRTADGHPDLQGTYANNSITPLERTKDFANKPLLNDAEYAELQQAVKDVLHGGDAPFGDELFIAASARNKN